jgi:hypothetical protein
MFENLLHQSQLMCYLQREIKPFGVILQEITPISSQCQQRASHVDAALSSARKTIPVERKLVLSVKYSRNSGWKYFYARLTDVAII